jgi:phosphatidate cytidylyltransferase
VGISLPIISFFLEGKMPDLSPFIPLLFGFTFFTCIYYLVKPSQESPTTNISITLMGVFLVALSLSHFILMLKLDQEISWTVPFTVIVMVWIYDAVAYFVGSALGKHKMAPRVSPNKSWEGTLAGTIGAFVAAWVLYLTVNRPWLSLEVALVLAAIVAVAGPVGDFTESLIKRELGIKDMSSLIPGHGGILDRFDSMLFTAVFSYYYLRLIIK